jgi:hypothetical protein
MVNPGRLVGSPETLVQLAQAADQAASELDELTALLDADVETIVPNRWNTPSSNWLQQWWDWLRDDVMKLTRNAKREWATALREAAAMLSSARDLFQRAVAFAHRHDCVVGENLVVTPLAQNPTTQAMASVAQYMVSNAWQIAEQARQRLWEANHKCQEELEFADQIMLDLLAQLSERPGQGGRRSGPVRPGTTLGIRRRRPVPPRRGAQIHRDLARAERPFEGQLLSNGYRIAGVERRFGGTGRPDVVYINDRTRHILIIDYYTGPVEPPAHRARVQGYRNLPDIQALRARGYRVDDMTVLVPPPGRLN